MKMIKNIVTAALSAAIVGMGTGSAVFAADVKPPAPLTPKPYEVTIAPGASYAVNALGFCISYAKPYPESNLIFPGGRVKDEIAQVLQYAVANKIITSTAITDALPYYSLELAVWKAADGNWHDWMNRGLVDAQKIYSEALKTPAPAIPANAFFSPIYSKTLEISVGAIRLIPDSKATGEPYLGETQITIKNISAKSVKVSIVPGALAGSTQSGQQDLGVMFAGLSMPETGDALGDVSQSNTLPALLVLAGAMVCALGAVSLMGRRQTAS